MAQARKDRIRHWSLLPVGTLLLAASLPAPARAQWGWGFGGPLPFQPTPATTYLNDRALIAQSTAAARAPTALRAPNPTMFRGRDPDFVPRFDVTSRRPSTTQSVYRPPSARQIPAQTQVASAVPAPAPAAMPAPNVPLASFFNQFEVLVWPAEAPIDGALGPKRITSDSASLAVLQQQRTAGAAPLSSVTEAREKLIQYGQPALQSLRETLTPRVADSFHLFLLQLYEALEQAAGPPIAGSQTPPAQP